MLFDLPEVIDAVTPGHPRMTRMAGDFFADPLPAADLYVLMHVLHDWDDQRCLTILQGVRPAAHPNARLLLIETVHVDGHPDLRRPVMDIIMLTATGGREPRSSRRPRRPC